MDHILYQIFKNILSIFKKKHNGKIDNPSLRIYVNKIENRITFKIKTGYYLKLLTPETMKLLGSTKNNKITNIKMVQMYHIYKITEEVSFHYNIVNSYYQKDSGALYTVVANKPFGQLLEISTKKHIFLKTFNSEFQAIEV